MISKLGVIALLKIRNYPAYWMPLNEIGVGSQLVSNLVEEGYMRHSYEGIQNADGYCITMKGADTIAENADWLLVRGYKLI